MGPGRSTRVTDSFNRPARSRRIVGVGDGDVAAGAGGGVAVDFNQFAALGIDKSLAGRGKIAARSALGEAAITEVLENQTDQDTLRMMIGPISAGPHSTDTPTARTSSAATIAISQVRNIGSPRVCR